MRKEASQRLVIDACVIGATGTVRKRTSDQTRRCRSLLDAILAICHRAVYTPELKEEWERHGTHFASRWRRSMVAHRKLRRVSAPLDQTLRSNCMHLARDDGEEDAMAEDVHLLEAAMGADRIVISCEKRSKALFDRVAQHYGPLREVAWVNPDLIAPEALAAWLEAGAEPTPEMYLGATIE